MQRRGGLLGRGAITRDRYAPSRRNVWLALPFALALLAAPPPSAAGELASKAPVGGPGPAEMAAYAFGAELPAPTVTLNPLPLISSDARPSFSGTASDTTPVTVSVYRGPAAEGLPIVLLPAEVNEGSWASGRVTAPLAGGKYTAVATQIGSLDNVAGISRPVSFEVNARSPAVSLSPPPARSNDTVPAFSGTASEATGVSVEVFEGTRPEGPLVAIATAPAAHGSWSSGPAAPALPGGRHTFTAVALQRNEGGDAVGESAPVTFVVDTEPPTVTLTPPPAVSNETTPSFSGTSTEATPVSVEVFAGSVPEGTPVASASATPAGERWTSAAARPALGDGTFTAIATQPSGIGNVPGRSAPVTFTIDTSAPTVTLEAPLSPSGNRAPSFSGTASDHTPVTVDIYAGPSVAGAVLASAEGEAGAGRWVSARASPPLPWGEYTAVARQPSSIGNPTGESQTVTFVVAPIAPAVATEAAASVTRTSAALYASVNPDGAGVAGCYFEYGSTPSYGSSVECGFVSEIAAFPPAGTRAVPVFVRIYGLSAGTGYHFRIVAVGEGGTGTGGDATFTTQPPWLFGEEGAAGAPSRQANAADAPDAAARIARQLRPAGRAARIATLLGSGVFKARFTAPAPGIAVIGWYYLPRAGGHSGRPARAPVLVAAGALRFHAAATATRSVRLTTAGRRLLAHAMRVRLTAVCVFTPLAGTPVRASATFELRR